MENAGLGFKREEIENLKELWESLLKSSGNNLDQYIDGDSFILSGDVMDTFRNEIKKFLEMAQRLFRKAGNKEKFFEILEIKPDCTLFMSWFKEYLEDAVKPYEDAAYLRKMELKQFTEMSSHVFLNSILFYNGEDAAGKTEEEQKQLFILKKVMYLYLDMIISRHYSREYADSTMDRIFGLNAEKCAAWYDLMQGNDDRLWKIMLMRKITSLENRLDQLVEDLG